jgi:CDGSH-type Zn-finger protein/uncharacterized Fe-S cluster protein YjdI
VTRNRYHRAICPLDTFCCNRTDAVRASEKSDGAKELDMAFGNDGQEAKHEQATAQVLTSTREALVHSLYEAAELEHNLMCTYLYAAFSLRDGPAEGLSQREAEAVARWRSAIMSVALEEMGHLTAVWNITSALGASPRFGRGNFPLDPGALPAGVVVKLAPFSEEVVQHFIRLEMPAGCTERDGSGFEPEVEFRRGVDRPRLTPMPMDYETVGVFYASLEERLREFVARVGENIALCGDPALQLSPAEFALPGAEPVICAKTADAALRAIVEQGEGAPADSKTSHFQRFIAIRDDVARLKRANPDFEPAFPAATNPLLRRPVRSANRIWIASEEAARTVDIANAGYALMLRLLAYSYAVPRTDADKSLAVSLGVGLMRAITPLAERAARLPASADGACNAGMSFTALRDAAALAPGASARRFFVERLAELSQAAAGLATSGDARAVASARVLAALATRAADRFSLTAAPRRAESVAQIVTTATRVAEHTAVAAGPAARAPDAAPAHARIDGVDYVEGEKLTVIYDGKKCIHARFCVTWGPKVFRAGVKGSWIHPDAMDAERVAEIAHACPSGAIRYKRKDGRPDEAPPPVNLLAVREAGPYAIRGDLRLDGKSIHNRATLCRCGASKNKPFCDNSHEDIGFTASGEPEARDTESLETRDGPLDIEPELDGPINVRGNLEITSGTGHRVACVTQARLCRCGGSAKKPFCDGTHARIGFRST